MRRRDIELITALAGGTLADETEARALIESSPRLRAEYEAQVRAIEALRSIPDEAMTALEKADLRRDIWTELRSRPAPAARKRGAMGWGYAAAGIFVLVGGVAVILNGLAGGESARFGSGELLSPAIESDEAPPPEHTDQPGLAFDDREIQSRLAAVAEDAREGRGTTIFATTAESGARDLDDDELDECLVRAGVEEKAVLGYVEVDGVDYLVTARTTDLDRNDGVLADREATLTFVATETCEVVYRDFER